MKMDLYKKIVDEANDIGVGAVTLASRGEPTMHKKYSEMLKNGMMLNSKLVNDKISSENKLILVKSGKKLVCIANLEKEYIIPRRNFNL